MKLMVDEMQEEIDDLQKNNDDLKEEIDDLQKELTREKENNIKKLAASYMDNNPSLTEDKAMEMARTILE